MPRPKTWKLRRLDRFGRTHKKPVCLHVDIRDFTDCAVFPFLLMAANPDLSARDLHDVLAGLDDYQWRSETWLETRRWMCVDAGVLPPSEDGLDGRAREIMRNQPRISSRRMMKLLRSNGIIRPLDWVYRSRNR